MKVMLTVNVSVEIDVPDCCKDTITQNDMCEMACTALGHNQAGLGTQLIENGITQYASREHGMKKLCAMCGLM